MRIAVIGSGISGLAAARVLARCGHEVVVYERSDRIGGVWAMAYPEVRLQNVAEHYRLSDFPWPFDADLHPTAEQVLKYMQALVEHFAIDARLGHEVVSTIEEPGGWQVEVRGPDGVRTEHFGYVIVAVGHYSDEKAELDVSGRETFPGQVLTERDVRDLSVFDAKRVAVVGFGKTAVDMATFAAERGASVTHVFRSARWLMPRLILGHHMSEVVTARTTTSMTPTWVHPSRSEAFLHKWSRPSVWMYWKSTEWLFRINSGLHPFHRDSATRERMALLEPHQPLTFQMRAAAALAPDSYYPMVRSGTILPVRGDVAGFGPDGLKLADGRVVPADVVVLAVGYKKPQFRFLPERYRAMLTADADGAQLYRHVLHPHIPNLALAGFNHGFLHVAAVELSMLWLAAVIAGDITLPTAGEMEASAGRVAAWKRRHMLFEPTRAWGIGNRFHQYFEVLLRELGVSPKRKKSWVSEWFEPYFARDYATVFEDHQAARHKGEWPRRSLPFDT